MTDTYIWEKIVKRFYSMKMKDKETGEIIEFPYFTKDDTGEITNVFEPNETRERPTNEIWFEIFPLHSQPRQQELGQTGRNRWAFGLQINVNAPRAIYSGTNVNDKVYDFIAANFKRGDIFDGIRVEQTAYRSSARQQDDYYSEPVTVMVQADLDNN